MTQTPHQTADSFICLHNRQEFDNVLSTSANKLVVIYFSALWCGPCRSALPEFKSVSKDPDFSVDVVFCKCDVDEVSEIAEECEVQCMPTFCFFRDQEKIDYFSGSCKGRLREYITKHK
ncbi:thioredoxin-like [Lytechinus variegatus]|uniref:thioredoxin-like n=1 Tax=Lytechinus variegatus TaxID=7654 RepID=UPI001BB22605|nr:thioredoxin-like [Lytechinus variegatus]